MVPGKYLRQCFFENLPEIRPLIEEATAKGLQRKGIINYAKSAISELIAHAFDVSPGVISRRIEYDDLAEHFFQN